MPLMMLVTLGKLVEAKYGDMLTGLHSSECNYLLC